MDGECAPGFMQSLSVFNNSDQQGELKKHGISQGVCACVRESSDLLTDTRLKANSQKHEN